MWLFFFHETEHKKISKSREKLETYIREHYDYAEWKFVEINSRTIQMVEIVDGTENEVGFIIEVEEIK